MAQGSGLTRGDRNRNRRVDALRAEVRRERAVLAVDLGEDKQVAVLVDHDGRVLARKTATVKAHELGGLLEWAASAAVRRGFAGLVVACEPTGHRWQAVRGLADAGGHGFVCVQPLAVARARESDDYTRDKTDYRDARLIGKLAARLECYLPERAGEGWALLRHLGARRAALVTDAAGCVQQVADLLGCGWPAVLGAARHPLESVTWQAAVAVVTQRCAGAGGLAKARKAGYEKFLAAVRRELPRWGGKLVRHAIVKAVWDALESPGGVAAQRRGVLARVKMLLEDWRYLRSRIASCEEQMLAALDELGVTALVTSIDGLSATGAAMILAEAGDVRRFASARALVKHAGLNPVEKKSATMDGKTTISRRGRPGLRTAAWLAAWRGIRHNTVLAARHAHLTGRQAGRLLPGQARAACAAALLRWIWAVITTGQPWDARIASGQIPARRPAAGIPAAA